MKKRTSVFARLFALIALLAAIAAVFFVASNALDEDSTKSGKQDKQQQEEAEKPKPKIKAATYEVKPGDTLTRISHLSGVKVVELIELNPEIDPQILVEGQIIKLR